MRRDTVFTLMLVSRWMLTPCCKVSTVDMRPFIVTHWTMLSMRRNLARRYKHHRQTQVVGSNGFIGLTRNNKVKVAEHHLSNRLYPYEDLILLKSQWYGRLNAFKSCFIFSSDPSPPASLQSRNAGLWLVESRSCGWNAVFWLDESRPRDLNAVFSLAGP